MSAGRQLREAFERAFRGLEVRPDVDVENATIVVDPKSLVAGAVVVSGVALLAIALVVATSSSR